MPQGDNTAVIRFDGKTHRCKIRGAVNGQRYEFPVDKDVTVTGEQLQALRDTNVSFDLKSPLAGEDADEGSSASSTETGTAIRAEPPAEAINPALEQGVPELSQRTDAELADAQKAAEDAAKAEAATGDDTGDGAQPAQEASPTTETGTATRAETPTPTPTTAKATTTKPKTVKAKAGGAPKAKTPAKAAAQK